MIAAEPAAYLYASEDGECMIACVIVDDILHARNTGNEPRAAQRTRVMKHSVANQPRRSG